LNDTDIHPALRTGSRAIGHRWRWRVQTIITAEIRDVGPWLTNDPYWAFNSARPRSCKVNKTRLPSGPNKGKVPTNPAGIDLSPALATALGVSGKGKVSWRLVT
jgi:hypothetical protein